MVKENMSWGQLDAFFFLQCQITSLYSSCSRESIGKPNLNLHCCNQGAWHALSPAEIPRQPEVSLEQGGIFLLTPSNIPASPMGLLGSLLAISLADIRAAQCNACWASRQVRTWRRRILPTPPPLGPDPLPFRLPPAQKHPLPAFKMPTCHPLQAPPPVARGSDPALYGLRQCELALPKDRVASSFCGIFCLSNALAHPGLEGSTKKEALNSGWYL